MSSPIMTASTGPLANVKVIELAGIGPAPMAGMMLADMGAEVIRIERSAQRDPLWVKDHSQRGKRSVGLNLKCPEGRELLLRLIDQVDVLIEGYRPGVVERLGIGPDLCLERNPRLIFGRVTGWGREGPLAQAAGHDINYISLCGALHAIGRPKDRPVPPLNLVGDMGGGGMLLTVGVLAALLERAQSGKGQVVDAAMIDGAALQMWLLHGMHASGHWDARERGVNLLDGGAPFYDTYETRDGQYVSIGSLEPQFYGRLCELLGLDSERYGRQMDRSGWSAMKAELTAIFKEKTRSEWCALLEGTDVCFAPVLSMTEAPSHPQYQARGTYVELDGFMQPGPAPRFSRTPSTLARGGARAPGEDGAATLSRLGIGEEEIAKLRKAGILTC